MILEHVAIWTIQLETLKNYYQQFFGGQPNEKYRNESTEFESFFLTSAAGARLELMTKPNLPDNKKDTLASQHQGITHLAFGVETMQEVEEKAKEWQQAGFPILRGPRKTGDGYYEFETFDPDNNRLEVTTLFVSGN
ncbi:glyoxalase [Adhaeribacter arboris]|uniref:Glyoxalase n=1 Tax=Adhaeribacter arboris TaxID=2072846 RepID=A0A2T2YLG8_9BACT|nr:VOC family protein [Adhaeribacter arboris]PSR56362.1 glyoxalase [Adhaeribacter arboris]